MAGEQHRQASRGVAFAHLCASPKLNRTLLVRAAELSHERFRPVLPVKASRRTDGKSQAAKWSVKNHGFFDDSISTTVRLVRTPALKA